MNVKEITSAENEKYAAVLRSANAKSTELLSLAYQLPVNHKLRKLAEEEAAVIRYLLVDEEEGISLLRS